MDIRDPEVQKTAAISAVILGLFYVFFFTDFMPVTFKARSAELREHRGRYEQLRSEVAKAKAAAEQLPALEAEVAQINQRWEEVSELMPTSKEIAGFLTKITVAGQESGVHFALVQPGTPVEGEFYVTYPVEISVDGGFHQVGRFLAEVGNLSRIVQIRNLKLNSVGGDEHDDRTVSASFTAEAYAIKEQPVVQAASATAPQ